MKSMTKELSIEHKQHLENIKKRLAIIGSKEASFLKIELLFYEAVDLAREYGNDVNENKFLAALKQLQSGLLQDTKAYFKKSTQREQAIRKFMTGFKSVLLAGMKNIYLNAPDPVH